MNQIHSSPKVLSIPVNQVITAMKEQDLDVRVEGTEVNFSKPVNFVKGTVPKDIGVVKAAFIQRRIYVVARMCIVLLEVRRQFM
jgi:hypothetical protein